MADYIHYRTSDNRVMAVYTTTQTPLAGNVEVFESHPVFNPMWDIAAWTRTGVGTYTGAPIDVPEAQAIKFKFKNTGADTTPDYLSAKLVAGPAIALTTVTPAGNETRKVEVDVNSLTEDTSPDTANDFLLEYDASAAALKKVKMSNATPSTALAAVQARRTTTYTLTTSYVDITLDVNDLQTDSSVVTHSTSTNTARITFLKAGTYALSYDLDAPVPSTASTDSECHSQLLLNGTTVVNGSHCMAYGQNATLDMSSHISCEVFVTLAVNDYVTLQLKYVNNVNIISTNLTFKALRLDGSSGNVFGTQFQNAESDAESTTTSTSAQTKLTMTTGTLPIGTYRLGWYFESTNTSILYTTITEILESATVHGREEDDQVIGSNYDMFSGYKYITYASATTHTFDMKYNTTNATGTAKIKRARFEIWRVS